jgi:hypothetical protein
MGCAGSSEAKAAEPGHQIDSEIARTIQQACADQRSKDELLRQKQQAEIDAEKPWATDVYLNVIQPYALNVVKFLAVHYPSDVRRMTGMSMYFFAKIPWTHGIPTAVRREALDQVLGRFRKLGITEMSVTDGHLDACLQFFDGGIAIPMSREANNAIHQEFAYPPPPAAPAGAAPASIPVLLAPAQHNSVVVKPVTIHFP